MSRLTAPFHTELLGEVGDIELTSRETTRIIHGIREMMATCKQLKAKQTFRLALLNQLLEELDDNN
jgi:hypothetical protein